MKREDVETDLDFVGFIIFENKLKSTTASVLAELTQSNISSIMVTGDNILTAISVGRNCGLIDENSHCFVPRFAEGNVLLSRTNEKKHCVADCWAGDDRDPNSRVEWESIDDTMHKLQSSSLQVRFTVVSQNLGRHG